MNNGIHNRAMLVSLRISGWTARKYDRKISSEVADQHKTTLDAGRYNKCLLPGDCDSYNALLAAMSEARNEHYKQTLAWSDEGWRLLPTANYLKYTEMVRNARDAFEQKLAAFLSDYPTLRDAAKLRLNGMYRDEDYPSVDALRSRYSFAVKYSPMPDGQDFRLNLAEDEISAIAQSTEARVKEAVEAAHYDAVTRLFECVSHIKDRLADPKAIFRDSLIENARELCDVLTRLNVTSDPKLDELRAQVASLATVEADELRENEFSRQIAAKQAAEILSSMQSVYGVSHAS